MPISSVPASMNINYPRAFGSFAYNRHYVASRIFCTSSWTIFMPILCLARVSLLSNMVPHSPGSISPRIRLVKVCSSITNSCEMDLEARGSIFVLICPVNIFVLCLPNKLKYEQKWSLGAWYKPYSKANLYYAYLSPFCYSFAWSEISAEIIRS